MGTQQILLIVLSVIIVGIAVAVGITMFNQQTVNSARTSIIGDMNNYAAQTIAWYKTPTSMGGAGRDMGVTGGEAALRQYLGFTGGTGTEMENDNGTYSVAISGSTAVITVVAEEPGLQGAGNSPVCTVNPTVNPETIVITYPTGT